MAKYHANGVIIHPALPSSQSTPKITYDGLLYQNGATEVYAHVGYGRDWKNTHDYKMSKTPNGFETLVPIPNYTDSLNVCFKDSANNWDNNSGANYSFAVNNAKDNTSLEVAEELSVWKDAISRCRSNVSMYKSAICRWFGSSR